MKLSIVVAALLVIVASACTEHRAYVATPYEPLLVRQKGDIQVGAGLRPFKFYTADATVAVSNHIAVRAGYGGFFDLSTYHFSVPVFTSRNAVSAFAAPLIAYQRNTINRMNALYLTNRKAYKYNCEYLSPGLATGISLTGQDGTSHHLLLKVQYNLVSKYSYTFNKDNGSGKNSSFRVLDNETLSYPLPDFLSFEPSYVIVVPANRHLHFRFGFSANICQAALLHKYTFQAGKYSNPIVVTAQQFHPKTRIMNISMGMVFSGNARKRTPIEEN